MAGLLGMGGFPSTKKDKEAKVSKAGSHNADLKEYYRRQAAGLPQTSKTKRAFKAASASEKAAAAPRGQTKPNKKPARNVNPNLDTVNLRNNTSQKSPEKLPKKKTITESLRETGTSPLKKKTNPKKQRGGTNLERLAKSTEAAKSRPGSQAAKKTNPLNKRGGTNLERTAKSTEAAKSRPGSGALKKTPPKPTARPGGSRANADVGAYPDRKKTPPKPTARPKSDRQLQKEVNRSPAAIKARKEGYSKKNSLSGNSINNEQKMESKQKGKKGFASGGGSRKNTSGSTDSRKGVVTKALSKMFNDKRSKAEMVKTRKQNQAFWDDMGPDK